MTKITTFLQDFATDESGASAAEYALILAIIGAGLAGAAFLLGEAIVEAFDTAIACMEDSQAAACTG